MKSDTKTSVFGTCYYERSSPPRGDITVETRILNINMDLNQALRLQLALSECIRKVNRYKENTIAGKKAVVNLAIHLDIERISVNEAKLPKEVKKKMHQAGS